MYLLLSFASKKLSTFYGELRIRDQPFKVLFDTGSCEFWVAGSLSDTCASHQCLNLSPQDHEKYHTDMYIEVPSTQYISGRVAGELIIAPVSIEGIYIDKQVIGVAESIDIPLFAEAKWDGIVGLAYANVKMRERGLHPLMDSLMREGVLDSNVFSYYVGKGEGAITFGGVNADYVQEGVPPIWVPLLETKYWTLELLNVLVGDYPLVTSSPRAIKAVIDTGTYLMYGPSAVVSVRGM